MIKRLEKYTVYLSLVLTIGLIVVTQRNSRNIDSMEDITQETQSDVTHIDSFVDELEKPPSEDEVARNQAITQAVALVPELKGILCEAFPETTPCE